MINKFPLVKQKYIKDCGPVSLQIVLLSYGINASINQLRNLCSTNRNGTTLLDLKRAAEYFGFAAKAVKAELTPDLLEVGPLIAYLPERKHYVVIYKITERKVFTSDPARGRINYTIDEFLKIWVPEKQEMGIALLLYPPDVFPEVAIEAESHKPRKATMRPEVFKIVKHYRWHFLQLLLFVASFSILQVLIPVLTQRLIDSGIALRDIKFIYVILAANLVVLIGRTFTEVLRSWLLLHLSARVNVHLLYTFFKKIFSLPISFFDSKVMGDYLQRIEDHTRVENLITSSSLNFLFNFITFIIYTVLLGYYSTTALVIFLAGSLLYFLWISFFFTKRAHIDVERFDRMTVERDKVYEILSGMQEIKLQNLQAFNLKEWTRLHLKLFDTNIKTLKVDQLQSVGSNFINELKNIGLVIFCATLVVDGTLSLGGLLAVSYVIGVLNAPMIQIFNFLKALQDTVLSIGRIDEIHEEKEEKDTDGLALTAEAVTGDIEFKNVKFKYYGEQNFVFSSLSFKIPLNKTTAIVGTSGSGKTTLMKLLLRFYPLDSGSIKIGNIDLDNISLYSWRDMCGTVMQEGFMFNGTIAKNIALREEGIDNARLMEAARVACIDDFINELPAAYQTIIGQNGRQLSGGQKQRILIARAIYKQPSFFLFDEATSSLDATNERNISINLKECFMGKTAIIIAHRLSTIRNADKIVVVHNGEIVEEGSHQELIEQKRYYHDLIKDQIN